MGRPLPYQPMGPRNHPAGDDDVARMFKKLASHTKPGVQVFTETQSPKEKSGCIEWREIVCYTSALGPKGSAYLLSRCGRWSITKDAHEFGFSYTAWDLSTKTNRGMAMNLGCRRTADEAKGLCVMSEPK